jgi:hypothetical protein
MKPFLHAAISAKKYGGKPEDYQALHEFFDRSKASYPSFEHRAIYHNSWGIFELQERFGSTIVNSDGKTVSTRDIGEDHVIQDLGFIPTLEQCINALKTKDSLWLSGTRKKMKTVSMKLNLVD